VPVGGLKGLPEKRYFSNANVSSMQSNVSSAQPNVSSAQPNHTAGFTIMRRLEKKSEGFFPFVLFDKIRVIRG
jgi:hypothetical protein